MVQNRFDNPCHVSYISPAFDEAPYGRKRNDEEIYSPE